MSKKSSLILFAIIVILIIIGIVVKSNRKDAITGVPANDSEFQAPTGMPPGTASSTTATSTGSITRTYTLADVAMHKDINSCWTTINGNVYDVTPFVPGHPGGEPNILKVCGIDGTALFTAQHDSQRKPNAQLAKLKIGILVK